MIFQGIKFRKSRTIVILNGFADKYNLRFGRICKETDRGSEKTEYYQEKWEWSEADDQNRKCKVPVFAKSIKITGYGRTNLAYTETHIIVAINGICYTAPKKRQDFGRGTRR